MKKTLKCWAVICTFLCVLSAAFTAFAYTGEKSSLTILFRDNDRGVSGVSFSMYRVADITSAGYKLCGDFAGYSVELNGLDSAGWKSAGETLAAYAQRDNAKPAVSGETDKSGKLVFGEMDTALYLISGSVKRTDTGVYITEPMLVRLPAVSEDGGNIYEFTVSPKFETEQDGGYVGRKAVKLWKSDDSSVRPESITVQLIKNGSVADEAVLNEANSWSHSWSNLESGNVWQVAEKDVPQGYTVSVSREKSIFMISNTYTGDIPEPPAEPRLPNTGVLWWPVPVFAGAGVLLCTIGLAFGRKDKTDEKN